MLIPGNLYYIRCNHSKTCESDTSFFIKNSFVISHIPAMSIVMFLKQETYESDLEIHNHVLYQNKLGFVRDDYCHFIEIGKK